MPHLEQRSVNRRKLLKQRVIFQWDGLTDNFHLLLSVDKQFHQYQSESRMKGDASE